MSKYKTIWDHNPDDWGEVNNEPSQTVQGESYTVRELYQKFSTGQAVDVARQGLYDNPDEDDFDFLDKTAYNRLDLTEKEEVKQQVRQSVKELSDDLKKKTKPAAPAEGAPPSPAKTAGTLPEPTITTTQTSITPQPPTQP